MSNSQIIPENAMEGASVAPPDAEHLQLSPAGNKPFADPRQQAGQDAEIDERLQDDPMDVDAQLDNGLDETMDGSDPVSVIQPGVGSDPVPSSGYNEDEERLRSNAG